MRDSVLGKLLAQEENEESVEGTDDYGAFGCLRGLHERSIMLEIRRKNGSKLALGYAWLNRATYDPSGGIELRFGGETIKLAGRNLDAEVRPNVRLFASLVRHRVPWIQEVDEATAIAAPKQAVVIEEVEIE